MIDIIEWRKSEIFHKVSFYRSMREVATQADSMHVEQRTTKNNSDKMEKSQIFVPHLRKSTLHEAKKYAAERKRVHLKEHEDRGAKQKEEHIEPPIFLYPRS